MVRLLAAASFLLLTALAGCSDDDGGGSVTVAIHQSQFDPKTITVDAGTTVTWVNHDSFRHTATADGWDSGEIDQDEEFDQPMDNVGTFAYRCKLHPAMTGTVIVQ